MEGARLFAQCFNILLVTLINPLFLFPDSVDLVIRNELQSTSITSIHYLVAGSGRMRDAGLRGSIPPGESASLTLPFRFMDRIVFLTDSKGNYRNMSIALSPMVDTIAVSRADREFGGLFDVIMGDRPYIIHNRTPVPITGIILHGDGLPVESLIGPNPLMTDETLFLWLDTDSLAFTAIDIEGNRTMPFEIRRVGIAAVASIRISAFLAGSAKPDGALWVINGINGESITGIEVYPLYDEPFFLDLGEAALSLWQSAAVQYAEEVEHIVCVDTMGRTYSIGKPDQHTEAFVADWWHLDFDFGFPERRR